MMMKTIIRAIKSMSPWSPVVCLMTYDDVDDLERESRAKLRATAGSLAEIAERMCSNVSDLSNGATHDNAHHP